MKKLLDKLLDNTGSSRNLAYELIDAGMPYDKEEAYRLANSIRKWKQKDKFQENGKNILKK